MASISPSQVPMEAVCERMEEQQTVGRKEIRKGRCSHGYLFKGCCKARQLTVDIFDKAKQLAVLVECLQ